MPDRKFYLLDICPFCRGDLVSCGFTLARKQILSCIKCEKLMLEKDINNIRKEINENSKVGK